MPDAGGYFRTPDFTIFFQGGASFVAIFIIHFLWALILAAIQLARYLFANLTILVRDRRFVVPPQRQSWKQP